MKLTTQLLCELLVIETRCQQMRMEIQINAMEARRNRSISSENTENSRNIIKRLNADKVRLENILYMTDIKERDHLLHSP